MRNCWPIESSLNDQHDAVRARDEQKKNIKTGKQNVHKYKQIMKSFD